METAKRESRLWWCNSSSVRCSPWLQSTLSELEEMTNSMLKIIDQEADSFAQRAEMYYEKRPQLISLIEDFYRTHRSLAIQFDQLKQDPSTRHTSSLARSFSLSRSEPEKATVSPCKSYDGSCFDSDLDSIASEVEDPLQVSTVNYDHLTVEIDRLKEDAMAQKRKLEEKEKAIKEMERELDETRNEVMELKEEAEKLKLDNDRLKDEKEKAIKEMEQEIDETRNEVMQLKLEDVEKNHLNMKIVDENERQKGMIEEKDEAKREAIRQLSIAIEMLKSENVVMKKLLFAGKSLKKWNNFGLKGFRKLFNG